MSDWDGFDSLDLSGVDADAGSARLKPGSYRVKCTKAFVEKTADEKGRKVVVDLVCKDGNGDIRNSFNVRNASAQAQEIGLAQLKGFLTAAKHPNPDKPGDIMSLVGLECVIVVGMGKPWRNNKGETRQNTEVKKWMSADSPATGPSPETGAGFSGGGSLAYQAPAGGVQRRDLDDEIPFDLGRAA